MKFYQKPTCSTCRKAKKWLVENGIKVEEVDLNQGLSEAEIETLIGKRDHKPFLNFRNELYRERKMKANPPAREEAIKLMSQHPNLIRRPILVKGSRIAIGFDEDEFRELSGR
ncbi:MAG: Spx/MgsR family RNA polymerase-binding regulatory protein [Bryobacteraceae bacterium]